MSRKVWSALSLAVWALCAQADEADIKKALEAKLGGKIESVTKTGYLGLYEVYADGNIFYTDEKVSVLLLNAQMVDGKTMRNLTEERMRKLTSIRFADLPLERAIKQVKGDGRRVLATFEDPNCGYCKRLAKEFQKLENVTLYTFLYPILSEDSVRKSRQIWCASDRAKAWNDWMIDGKLPPAKEDCDTAAVTKNQDYGRKLNIQGTPTIFFADGERVPGALPLARIEQKLNQIK